MKPRKFRKALHDMTNRKGQIVLPVRDRVASAESVSAMRNHGGKGPHSAYEALAIQFRGPDILDEAFLPEIGELALDYNLPIVRLLSIPPGYVQQAEEVLPALGLKTEYGFMGIMSFDPRRTAEQYLIACNLNGSDDDDDEEFIDDGLGEPE